MAALWRGRGAESLRGRRRLPGVDLPTGTRVRGIAGNSPESGDVIRSLQRIQLQALNVRWGETGPGVCVPRRCRRRKQTDISCSRSRFCQRAGGLRKFIESQGRANRRSSRWICISRRRRRSNWSSGRFCGVRREFRLRGGLLPKGPLPRGARPGRRCDKRLASAISCVRHARSSSSRARSGWMRWATWRNSFFTSAIRAEPFSCSGRFRVALLFAKHAQTCAATSACRAAGSASARPGLLIASSAHGIRIRQPSPTARW